MEHNELKPCPFCGGEAKVIDYTGNIYGFSGYEIKCKCGCRVKSVLCGEMYYKDGKICTPKTEQSKAKALNDLIKLWNGRCGTE